MALVQELDDPVGDGVLDALPGGLSIGRPPALAPGGWSRSWSWSWSWPWSWSRIWPWAYWPWGMWLSWAFFSFGKCIELVRGVPGGIWGNGRAQDARQGSQSGNAASLRGFRNSLSRIKVTGRVHALLRRLRGLWGIAWGSLGAGRPPEALRAAIQSLSGVSGQSFHGLGQSGRVYAVLGLLRGLRGELRGGRGCEDGLPGGCGGEFQGCGEGLPGEAGGPGAAWGDRDGGCPLFSTGFGDRVFPRASQSFPSGVMFGRWPGSWVGISALGMTRVLEVSAAPATARRWPGVLPVVGCPSSRGLGSCTRPGRVQRGSGRREAWKPCPGRGGRFLPSWGADDPGAQGRGASLGRRSGGDGRDSGGTGGSRAGSSGVRGIDVRRAAGLPSIRDP